MKNYKHFSEFPVDNQSGINKPSKVNNVKYKLNPQGSILNQTGTLLTIKRAHFKDWRSKLINELDVEKLLKKVIEFENLSILQIRINLDLQTDHNKTLSTSQTSSANMK